jgi:uncharacterized repeat protein (TIGR03803 family)
MNRHMRCNRYSRRATPFLLSITVFVVALTAAASGERKESVLYSFQSIPDGATPFGGVVLGKDGNLYSTTTYGGANPCSPSQCGTVFQLAPPAKQGEAWTETVIYVFQGNTHGDGNTPQGGVIFDPAGNLYGTTAYGGTGNCILLGTKTGCGTVYQMQPPRSKRGAWTEKVLYSFKGGKDGQLPQGELVFDRAGNIYGATQYGGGYGSCNAPFYQHCGTVFEVSPPKVKGGKWTEKVLYSFKSGQDGANPNGGLVFDRKGAIYGTTIFGGGNNRMCKADLGVGCGTLFKLSPSSKNPGTWNQATLYRFQAGKDGAAPNGGLAWDSKGALYGTTFVGGSENGTVFRFDPPVQGKGNWIEHLLFVFQSCGDKDGCSPWVGPTFGPGGDMYATAGGGASDGGIVFRMKPPKTSGGSWSFAPVYSFHGSPDGFGPGGIALSGEGTIYGVTEYGGTGQPCQGGCGTVFAVAPSAGASKP